MIPETENLQEAKSVRLGYPARHALADPGRYFTQSPHCWFSSGTAHLRIVTGIRVFISERNGGKHRIPR